MLNQSSSDPIYKPDPDLVTTVPADGLAPDGSKPSAGTVMITRSYKLDVSIIYLEDRRKCYGSKQ